MVIFVGFEKNEKMNPLFAWDEMIFNKNNKLCSKMLVTKIESSPFCGYICQIKILIGFEVYSVFGEQKFKSVARMSKKN